MQAEEVVYQPTGPNKMYKVMLIRAFSPSARFTQLLIYTSHLIVSALVA